MVNTIREIVNFCKDYSDTIIWIFGLLSIFIEFKPNTKFKFWSNLFKWIGKYINNDIREEIKSLNNKLNENHDESMQAISETNKAIEIVDLNRKEDTQAVLKNDITKMYYHYLELGYILENDKENFNSMFTRYTLSGGNSYVKHDVAPFINSLPRFLSDADANDFYKQHGNYDNGTQDK